VLACVALQWHISIDIPKQHSLPWPYTFN
jgi:hypothetical protein